MKNVSNEMSNCKVDTRAQLSDYSVLNVYMIDEEGLVKNMALCITIKRKKQKKCWKVLHASWEHVSMLY